MNPRLAVLALGLAVLVAARPGALAAATDPGRTMAVRVDLDPDPPKWVLDLFREAQAASPRPADGGGQSR